MVSRKRHLLVSTSPPQCCVRTNGQIQPFLHSCWPIIFLLDYLISAAQILSRQLDATEQWSQESNEVRLVPPDIACIHYYLSIHLTLHNTFLSWCHKWWWQRGRLGTCIICSDIFWLLRWVVAFVCLLYELHALPSAAFMFFVAMSSVWHCGVGLSENCLTYLLS